MLSLKMLHDIDYKYRKLKGDEAPFGGIPVVMLSGDFFQMPPVNEYALYWGRRRAKRRRRREYEREEALGGI
jgi:hypothetical protein